MQKKKETREKLKKIICMMEVMLLTIFLLSGCNRGSGEEKIQEETQETAELNESVNDAENQDEAEAAEKSGEPDAENTEEESGTAEEKTMEARLTELGLAGICLVVWNDTTATEKIIQNGDSYEKQEGDRFFICTPSMMIDISSNAVKMEELKPPFDNYCEIFLMDFQEDEDVEMNVGCENGEEGSINFCMLKPDVQSGMEWVKSLGYDEPKMVVWNDTTGLRKELEEGEEYQLNTDDIVVMYVPDDYIFDNTNIGQENITKVPNIAFVEFDKYPVNDILNLEMSAMHTETFDIITLHVTLLPPTE